MLITADKPGYVTERSAEQAKVILERLRCEAVLFRVEAGRKREEMVGALVEAVDVQ